MPFTVHVHPALRLATLRFSEKLDGDRLLRALEACYAQPLWQPGFNTLWDYRRVTEVVLEPGDMQRVVDFGFAHQARGGTGLDVNLVDCERGLHALTSRSFVAYRNYRKGALRSARSCCHEHEAEAALGLPAGTLHALLGRDAGGEAARAG